ncbi:hypothetical protein BX600DRAFT_440035 [Xylariales sp. PMI_506]|nr:hypothetical protein BX600DRAFT_440035 [Xylariales sp. PMI_506]
MTLNLDLGKPEFMETYAKVRQEVGVAKHIQRGWIATGIHPRMKAKALNNRFVRSSSKSSSSTDSPATPKQTPTTPNSELVIVTPESSQDLFILERRLRKADPRFATSTARILFRKIGKALDNKVLQNSSMAAENDILKLQNKKRLNSKRKKVIPAPNEDFARIIDIRKVKEDLGIIEKSVEDDTQENDDLVVDELENDTDSIIQDCITYDPSDSGSNWSSSS